MGERNTLRPWVNSFAVEMERKLQKNRHKGDRDGWKREPADWLLARLRDEVEELAATLRVSCPRADIRGECADVANFAMMISDVAGGLKPKRGGSPNG